MLQNVTDCRFDNATDVAWMKHALAAARVAAEQGEVPIGAVVVSAAGELLGVGHNAPIGQRDPSAHAEVIALRDAARRTDNYRLEGAELFVTAEPCLMCVGAAMHARIGRVVFGCREPKTGALGSRYDLRMLGDAPQLVIEAGICAAECGEMLREFFKIRRGA